MKETPRIKKAVTRGFTMVMAFVLMMAMVPSVLAESQDVGAIADFDSVSGSCINDAAIYSTTPGIALDLGYGIVDLDDWETMTCSFYIYFSAGSATDELVLTISDNDDNGNSIVVVINAYSTDYTKVTVSDKFNGETSTVAQYNEVDTSAAWALVKITISDTDKSTDGTTLKFDIDIGTADFKDCDFNLKSSEVSIDPKARKWNDFKFASEADTSEVWVDTIDINTTSADMYGYNWTVLLIVTGAIFMTVAYWRRWWPMNGKLTAPTKTGPKRKLG